MNGYIDDGYTELAAIPAREGEWAELKLLFRPMSAGEHSEYALRAELASDAALPDVAVDMLSRKILDWNLTDGGGRRLEVTAANLLRLKSGLFLALAERILGCQTEADLKNCDAGCG
jgi:hypothetical protein